MITEETIHACQGYTVRCNSVMLEFLEQNSELVQVFVTITLVLVTIYYAFQTRGTVKEMKKARLDGYLPVLEPNGVIKDDKFTLTINNVGRGLAKSVRLYILGSSEYKKIWNLDSRGVRKSVYDVDMSEILHLFESNQKIRIEYCDIFDRDIVTEAELVKINNSEIDLLEISNWSLVLPK